DSRTNDYDIDPGAVDSVWLVNVDVFRAFDSLRCDLISPRENQRDGKTDDDYHHQQSNDQVWNVKDGKHLSDSLRERPTSDDVSKGDLVNVTALQLVEEISAH